MTQEEMLQALSAALTGPAGNVPMLRPPAQVDEIVRAEEQLAYKFPLDYRLFLQMTNGAEFVEAIFWSAGEMPAYNIEYQFPEFAPWFVAIGSNGGGRPATAFRQPRPGQAAAASRTVPAPVAQPQHAAE
jgi:hypothetical protein